MGWFKLDDGFDEDPKIEALGMLGGWYFLCSLTYCGRNYETRGFIPETRAMVLAPIPKPKNVVAKLVELGLWTPEVLNGVSGYRVTNWVRHQPKRNPDRVASETERKKEYNAERTENARKSRGARNKREAENARETRSETRGDRASPLQADTELDTSDDNNRVLFSTGPPEPDVDRPDPERPGPDVSSSSEQKTADDLVKQVCRELATRALAGRPDVENPEAWHATTRRKLHAEKGQDIAAFAAANPGLDAVAIADHFEAKTSAARPPKPADPIEATGRAAAALAARNEADQLAANAKRKADRDEFERRWSALTEAEQHAVMAQAQASVPERLKGRFGPEQAALQAAVLAIPANRVTPDGRQPNQEQTMNELQEARA